MALFITAMARAREGEMEQPVITRTARVWLDEEGIVRADFLDGAVDTLETAKENVRAGIAVGRGRRRPLLCDISKLYSMNRQARIYYTQGERREGVELAVALIVRSHLGRAIGHFLVGLNRSSFPTRLFVSRDDALSWLRQFLQG